MIQPVNDFFTQEIEKETKYGSVFTNGKVSNSFENLKNISKFENILLFDFFF
jgi:hypothetical protein